jgi:hypothetical protein
LAVRSASSAGSCSASPRVTSSAASSSGAPERPRPSSARPR